MSNNRSKQPELVYRPATRTEQITDLLRVAGMLLGTTATATAAAVTTAVLAAFYFLPDLLLVPEGSPNGNRDGSSVGLTNLVHLVAIAAGLVAGTAAGATALKAMAPYCPLPVPDRLVKPSSTGKSA